MTHAPYARQRSNRRHDQREIGCWPQGYCISIFGCGNESERWREVISASGQVEITCVVVPGQSETVQRAASDGIGRTLVTVIAAVVLLGVVYQWKRAVYEECRRHGGGHWACAFVAWGP